MRYQCEWERAESATRGMTDGAMRAYYKARGPLGDAEFYRQTQTLPADLSGRLDELLRDLREKVTPARKAALADWKDAWRAYPGGSAPAIGTEAWQAQVRTLVAAGANAPLAPIVPYRDRTVQVPLFTPPYRHRYAFDDTRRQQAAFWYAIRHHQSPQIARDIRAIIRATQQALNAATETERAA